MSEQSPGSEPPRRERKKRDTRRRIAEGAWSLFVEKGYAATTIQDISAAADIAERTFFRYFPSKEALLFADGEDDAIVLAEALRARPADEPCWVALQLAFRVVAARLAAKRDHLLLRHEIARSLGEQSGNWAVAVGRTTNLLDEAVASRLGHPEDRSSAEIVAGTALAVTGVAYFEWVDGGCTSDLAQGFTDAFETLARVVSEGTAGRR